MLDSSGGFDFCQCRSGVFVGLGGDDVGEGRSGCLGLQLIGDLVAGGSQTFQPFRRFDLSVHQIRGLHFFKRDKASGVVVHIGGEIN